MRPAQSLELPGLTLLRPVGSGSFGEVWLARSVTGQFRAVKIVWLRRPDEDAANPVLEDLGDRVFRGVQQYLHRIPPGSPAGLAVLHVDRDPAGRFFYYVMELADDAIAGRDIHPESYIPLTLSELRRRSSTGCLSATETLRIGIRLAEGLEMLHRAGLVHRDLKPSNIVFVGGEARIADIDLVRPNEASMSLAGTLGYAPPEGPGRPPGDVYSLARTLYVAVTGLAVGEFPRLPDDWDQREDADALRRLNAILLRACDRNPALRPADGASIRAELLRVAAGEDPERSRRLKHWARLASWTAAIATPTALIALLLARQYQNQVKEKEQALREKTFALYRAYLADAASNLARNQLGNAQEALKRARETGTSNTGIELDILERQAKGDRAIEFPSVGSSIDQLEFSPDGRLLAAATGNNEVRIFQTGTADRGAVTIIKNVAALGGFLASGNFIAGSDSTSPRLEVRPMAVWEVATGIRQTNMISGRWLPVGIDRSDDAVVGIDFENPERVLHWNQAKATSPLIRTWHPGLPRDTNNIKKLAAIASRSGHVVYRQSVGLGDQYVSQLFAVHPGVLSYVRRDVSSTHIRAIAISPDASLAAYSEPSRGTLALLSLTHRIDPVAEIRDGQIESLAFAEDGKHLYSGGVDKLVQIRTLPSLRVEQSLAGHKATISAIAESPRRHLLASGDKGGEIRLWSYGVEKAPNQTAFIPGFKSGPGATQLIASANESRIAVSAGTNSIAVIDVATLKQQRLIEGIHIPITFGADDRTLWGIDSAGTLRQVDCQTGATLFGAMAFTGTGTTPFGGATPDGKRLILFNNEEVVLWRLDGASPSRHPLQGRQPTEGTIDYATSPDSRWAITVGQSEEAILWNLDTAGGQPIGRIPDPSTPHGDRFVSAAFLDDSATFLIGSDGALLRGSIHRPERLEPLPNPVEKVTQILPIPGGKRLLVSSTRARVAVLDLETAQPIVWATHRQLAAVPGEHEVVRLLHLRSDKRVIGLTEDGVLAVW